MSLDPIKSLPKGVLSEAAAILGKPKTEVEVAKTDESLLEAASKRIEDSQKDALYEAEVTLQESGDPINKEKARAFKAGEKNASMGGNRSRFPSPNIAAKYAKAETGLKALKATRASRTAVAARNAGEDNYNNPKKPKDAIGDSQLKIKNHKMIHDYHKKVAADAANWVEAHHTALLDAGFKPHTSNDHSTTYTHHDPESNTLTVAKLHKGGSETQRFPVVRITNTHGATTVDSHSGVGAMSGNAPDHAKRAKQFVNGMMDKDRMFGAMQESVDLVERNDDLDDLQYRKVDASKKKQKRFADKKKDFEKKDKKEYQYESEIVESDDGDEDDYKSKFKAKKEKRFADKKRDQDKKEKKEYQYESEFAGLAVEHEELGEGFVLDIQEGIAEVVFGDIVEKVDVESLFVVEADDTEIQE